MFYWFSQVPYLLICLLCLCWWITYEVSPVTHGALISELLSSWTSDSLQTAILLVAGVACLKMSYHMKGTGIGTLRIYKKYSTGQKTTLFTKSRTQSESWLTTQQQMSNESQSYSVGICMYVWLYVRRCMYILHRCMYRCCSYRDLARNDNNGMWIKLMPVKFIGTKFLPLQQPIGLFKNTSMQEHGWAN